jgi:methyl-accepting chemotaxis protein
MATIDDVRDNAHEVSSTTEEIVHEAEKQERAVFELSDRVRELSTTADGDSAADRDHGHDRS